MSERDAPYSGGCLCGALRYEATGEPSMMGHCYCADCRKASGSGFIPFMSFPASAIRFSGQTRQFRSPSFRGTEALRNSCHTCGGLVFGGEVGKDDSHTIYAGSLDDASRSRPQIAIFDRDRPAWAALPPKIAVFDTLPA